MENAKEAVPQACEPIPNVPNENRLKVRILQLVRDENVSESEANEYIKVS